MTESFRVARVEKEIQQVVAEYIQRNVNFPSGVLFSITRVESTKELRTAKIFYSFLGDESKIERAQEVLDQELHSAQKHLNKSMHMKFVPRISFVLDRGLEHMMKIQGILHKVKDE